MTTLSLNPRVNARALERRTALALEEARRRANAHVTPIDSFPTAVLLDIASDAHCHSHSSSSYSGLSCGGAE